jgi:nicotinamide mononucleotide (NMN) deamidase PncC
VPAGTVWVAVSSGADHAATGLALTGDRDDVRRGAAAAALELALNFQPSA